MTRRPRWTAASASAWGWYAPQDAIDSDDVLLAFPTVKTLEGLATFASADALIEWASGQTVEPVEPKVVVEGEVAKILLPGDDGYSRSSDKPSNFRLRP